jgi:phospholipid/cholesterol/gamma-HCH transport system substrate-binding protein
MDRDRRLSLTVGGFTLLSLSALALAVLQLSAEQGLFQPRYQLVAYFRNVQGLVGGAQVWLAGTRVGQVKRVDLATSPSGEPGVRVLLEIDREVEQRIRQDSLARIATVGLLGDQIVEISIGSAGSPMLADGGELATQAPVDLNAMLAEGGRALESIRALAARLDETLADFTEAGGVRSLGDSLAGLEAIIAQVQEGEGMLHSLVYEPYEGSAVESLEGAMASARAILAEIESGEGVLHSLVYDEDVGDGVMLEVVTAGANLNSILGKIDRGEGSLGLLLNDPTLYEELKLLVGGARRSTLVRSMIDMVTPSEE